MTTYQYETSSFPVSPDLGRLDLDIKESAIVTALETVKQDGTTVSIIFKAALSVGDKTILDTIVGSHDGEPLPAIAVQVSLEGPKTSDGKPIFLPSVFPGGVYLYVAGAGDDVEHGTLGNGVPFKAATDVQGDAQVEWDMLDWAYFSSGGLSWQGAEIGDWITLEYIAPASPVTPGNGTGNCNLVPPSQGAPAILIVPANGNGAYNVDLSKASLVPAFGAADEQNAGHWDWDTPDTGKGIITPHPSGGGYYLFAVDMKLGRFVNRFHILGTGSLDLSPPPIKSKRMLPHWRGRVTVHNSGHAGLKTAWYLILARARTV